MLVLVSNAAEAAVWNGWARCEITTRGPGYEQIDTHTWIVNGASGNTPATFGTGSWQASGKGNINQGNPAQTSMRGEWAINGMAAAPTAKFMAVVNGATVSIRPAHSQLRTTGGIVGYVQQTINNSPRSPTTISGTTWEWQLPNIQGSATGQTLIGTSSGTHPIGWAYMQASGSTVASACQWSLGNGFFPPPPPPVSPVPPPPPPGSSPPPPPPTPPPSDPCAAPVRGSGSVQISAVLPRTFRQGDRITVCGSQLSMASLQDSYADSADAPSLSSPSTALFVLIGPRSLMATDVVVSESGDRMVFTAGALYERTEATKDFDVLIPVRPMPRRWQGEFAVRLQSGAVTTRGPNVGWSSR